MSIKEISAGELKKYISSSKSVRLMPEGCKIPRNGRVVFNFADFNDVYSCKVRIKRLSGNGKIIVTIGNQPRNFIISSRNYSFNIELDNDNQIEISRPGDGLGEIVITGIAFEAGDVKESAVSINWKHLINRCGKYGCLRLVKGRLFASSGGFIERGDLISQIHTDPPNAYKYDGKKLIFHNGCEIKNLILVDKAPKPAPKQLFIDRQAPTEIAVAQNASISIPKPKRNELPPMQLTISERTLRDVEHNMLFDSNVIDFSKIITGKNKFIKAIKSLGKKYLLLKQNAFFKLPITALEANSRYICIINAKSISGNGKLRLGLSNDDNYYGDVNELYFSRNMVNKYISLQSDNNKDQKAQYLHMMMPAGACTGEILINRIVLIRDIDIQNISRINIQEPRLRSETDSNTNFNISKTNSSTDQYYLSVKKYARYSVVPKQDDLEEQSFKKEIFVTSTDGMSWFSKIKSVYPNITLNNNQTRTGLSISQVGHIQNKEYIWLDAFKEITNQDLGKLNGAKIVFSPSVANCQELEYFLPSSMRIQHLRKPLFWTKPKPISLFSNLEYVVAFDRSPAATERIVNSWNNKLPILVLVGARGNYPDYVLPTNEYMQFNNLLYILSKAKCVIDIPVMRDYESSFIALSMAMGIPVVSTNWYVLDKVGSVFMIGDDIKDDICLPAENNLKLSVDEAMSMKIMASSRQEYNEIEKNNFKQLFGF